MTGLSLPLPAWLNLVVWGAAIMYLSAPIWRKHR